MGRHRRLTRWDRAVLLRADADGIARDVGPLRAARLERAGLVVRHWRQRGPLVVTDVALTPGGESAVYLLREPDPYTPRVQIIRVNR